MVMVHETIVLRQIRCIVCTKMSATFMAQMMIGRKIVMGTGNTFFSKQKLLFIAFYFRSHRRACPRHEMPFCQHKLAQR